MCVLVFCVYVWLTPVNVYNLTAGSCSGLVIWSAASRCDALWNHLRWPDRSIERPLSTHTRSTLILLYYSLQQVASRLYSHTITSFSMHVSVIVWCKCWALWIWIQKSHMVEAALTVRPWSGVLLPNTFDHKPRFKRDDCKCRAVNLNMLPTISKLLCIKVSATLTITNHQERILQPVSTTLFI